MPPARLPLPPKLANLARMPAAQGSGSFRFDVALSLAGKNLDYVREVDRQLCAKLGAERVFFYERYQHLVPGRDADTFLQTDSRTSSTPAGPGRTWAWRSTLDSRAAGRVSVLACAETLGAVALYWWIAIHYETHWHLVSSVFIAPLLMALGALLLQDRTWQTYVSVPEGWVRALEQFYRIHP